MSAPGPLRTVGFIGLGAMGRPMAGHLLAKGFTVRSSAHRRREAIEALKARGLIEAAHPRAVAEGAEALFLVVRDVPETEAVLRGPDGALAGLAPGSAVVLMSTLTPAYCRALAEQAAPMDIAVVDSPVSGLPPRARAGTLTLMVGGDEATVERLRPALEAMGTINRCGGLGMGMVAKLANNLVSLTTPVLVSEATRLAKAHGMDPATLLEIMSRSTADGFTVRNWQMVAGLWPEIRQWAVKDLRLFVEAAEAEGLDVPLGRAVSRHPWMDEA
jgi:3-hydroxyisobutyrate dehydrogenase-like beta-hydroxyacid dehydrogenase